MNRFNGKTTSVSAALGAVMLLLMPVVSNAQLGGILGGAGGGGGVGGIGGTVGGIGVPMIGPNIGPSIGPSIGIGGLTPNVGPTLGGINRTANRALNNVRPQVRGVQQFTNQTAPSLNQGQLQAMTNPATRAALGVMFGNGLQISNVLQNSAAAAAGLQAGDRIQAINGVLVSSPQALTSYLSRLAPNQPVQLLVNRGGLQQLLSARLGTAEIFSQAQGTINHAQNLVGNVEGRANQAVNGVQNRAGQAINGIENRTNQTVNAVENQANQTLNSAENQANRTLNSAENQANRIVNGVQNQANQTLGAVENNANRAVQAVDNTANQVGATANQAVNNAVGQVNNQVRDARQFANQTLQNAQQTVRNTDLNAGGQFGVGSVNSLAGGNLQSAANAASQAALGVMFGQGTRISQVLNNSAAFAAGLRPGDQILAINGLPVNNAQQVTGILRNAVPNQQVQIVLNRNGLQQQIVATLGTAQVFNQVDNLGRALNQDLSNTVGQVQNTVNSVNAQAGIGANGNVTARINSQGPQIAANVDPQAALGVSFTNGLNVTQVLPNTQAFLAGLRTGDQIVSLNGTQLATPQQLISNLLTVAPNQTVDLAVMRNGQVVHLGMAVDAGRLLNQVNVAARQTFNQAQNLRDNVEGQAIQSANGLNQRAGQAVNQTIDSANRVNQNLNNNVDNVGNEVLNRANPQ